MYILRKFNITEKPKKKHITFQGSLSEDPPLLQYIKFAPQLSGVRLTVYQLQSLSVSIVLFGSKHCFRYYRNSKNSATFLHYL